MGEGLQGQDFRLDIAGTEISDQELADYLVEDLRLLMVGRVEIWNKRYIENPTNARDASAGAPA
jgi:hypothetical protein